LLVTQNLGIVANYCDRVLIMADGTIVESAPVRGILPGRRRTITRRRYSRCSAPRRATIPQGRWRARPDVAPGAPLISVRNLSKDFDIRGSKAKVHAVDHASFDIRPRECLGLVGESGSGKTTVAAAAAARSSDGGEVLFGEIPLHSISDDELRRFRTKLQIVFQDPFDSMNPRWSVAEIVGEMLDLHTSLRGAEESVLASTNCCPSSGLIRRSGTLSAHQLSAGRQQRIAIARAIATDPDFIVLDEPTSRSLRRRPRDHPSC
jgi:ABC-type glutathione transport system ATPase component